MQGILHLSTSSLLASSMRSLSDSRGGKVAFVGNYPPRRCGIATFTYDLRSALVAAEPHLNCPVVAVSDLPDGYSYASEVYPGLEEQSLSSYSSTREWLNAQHPDVVCLQHEFGIYGGPAGRYILELLNGLSAPVVTTLHTVLQDPDKEQREVMHELIERSSTLVVMSERGRAYLLERYAAPSSKVHLIPHGIPDVQLASADTYKATFDLNRRFVLLTLGLLSPNKGVEVVLKALPEIAKNIPNVCYVIAGATHPNLIRQQGDRYRQSLDKMIADLGIRNWVQFRNRFLDYEEMLGLIGAADVYLTPYLNEAQIVSGALAMAVGCGKAIVSTPYWHAEELLKDEVGALVPFGDSRAVVEEVIRLHAQPERRRALCQKSYQLGRSMIWSKVAESYLALFDNTRGSTRSKPAGSLVRPANRLHLPDMSLSHLKNLTDETGLVQHVRYTIPNFHEGYCTDDNARALALMVLLEPVISRNPEWDRLTTKYAAFLDYAFNRKTKRFRNFMSFHRTWLDDVGADDAQGRAVWALGLCSAKSTRPAMKAWASALFADALTALVDTSSPRGWAFGLLGGYAGQHFSNSPLREVVGTLFSRLDRLAQSCASPDWLWFENRLTYDNARLAQAYICAAHALGNSSALERGLSMLRWLHAQQTAPEGHFRPIGSKGFYEKGGVRAQFDQQPLDVWASVAAYSDAYLITNDDFFLRASKVAFDWFLGRNDLNLAVYDFKTGGCFDGLQESGVNKNEGAESTLSYLHARAAMHYDYTR